MGALTWQVLAGIIVAGFAWWFVRRRKREGMATFADAVPVLDPDWLDAVETVYLDVVDRIRDVRPEAVKHPAFSRRVYLHDGPLPAPYTTRWGVAFPEHADGGNAGGTLVLRRDHKDDLRLWAHECAHLITGITEHPAWLFGPDGLSLNV